MNDKLEMPNKNFHFSNVLAISGKRELCIEIDIDPWKNENKVFYVVWNDRAKMEFNQLWDAISYYNSLSN